MQRQFIFVEYRSGVGKESGKAYAMLTVSDGLRTATLPNPKGIDFASFREGDKIELELDLKINYRGSFEVIPLAII